MYYYQFNIGDYASHTQRLSLLEDLAYRRLLDEYYLHERPFNSGLTSVARQIGMREHENEVQFVLESFFHLTDDGWINVRADKEIAHFKGKIEQASRAGKASAERRNNGRSTDVQLTNNQEPITNNHKPDIYIAPNGSIGSPEGDLVDKKGKKLPGCNHQAVIDLYHEHLPTMRRIEVWNDQRAGYLRQRWREVAAELALEGEITAKDVLSWWGEFFQHIDKSKFLTGKVNSKDGRAFTADLEWIVRPSNFAKIVEGKYHGNN
jgi:uncharacterized protein YdaU (DUF1376 family)